MENNICVGVDIGGTSVKLGIFSTEGELIKKWEIPTDRTDNCKNVISDVAKSIKYELSLGKYTLTDCVGIGMGVPGPVLSSGYVKVCVNLGWKECYPARELSEILEGMPVKLGNDANVAALGETWAGGARGFSDAVMITLGTGVGGGVIIDGKIVAGRHGLGGEVGHIHIRDEEKEACNCGGHGCLEQIASATGIRREALRKLSYTDTPSLMRELGDKLTCKDVFDCAKAGDEVALDVIEVVSEYLGLALSYIGLLTDPDVIVIGGGVSKAGEYLLDIVNEKYNKYLSMSDTKAKVVLATLGNDAGIYGAAKLCLG
jgi:ROK family protein